LQLIPDAAPRDHRPVCFRFAYRLDFGKPEGGTRWDYDRLVAAWRWGVGREAFLRELEADCISRSAEWSRGFGAPTADDSWSSFVRDVSSVAAKHFELTSPKKKQPDPRAELRRDLLWQRRTAREWGVEGDEAERLKQITQELRLLARKARQETQEQTCAEISEAQKHRNDAVVHRLSRKLGGAGVGVRKRNYRLPPAAQASLEEWRETLALPGHQGGMAAIFIEDWQAELGQYKAEAPPLSRLASPELTLKARQQIEGVQKILIRSGLRKAVPAWSLPTVIFLLILKPWHRWKAVCSGAGVGGRDRAPPQVPEVMHRLLQTMVHTLRVGEAPLQAHESWPCLIHKKFDPNPCLAVRMIHVLCPWWRAWFRVIRLEDPRPDPPPDAYGSAPGRRREGAILVQNILAEKYRRNGVAFAARGFFDATNAFASTKHEVMEKASDQGLNSENKTFVSARRANSHFKIVTPTGETTVVPKTGSLMGDSNAPEDFVAAYQEPLNEWDKALAQQGFGQTVASTRVGGEQWTCQISRTQFVDDVAATSPPLRDEKQLLKWLRASPEKLSESMKETGHSINQQKTVWQPLCSTGRDRAKICAAIQDFKLGSVAPAARYLGPHLSFDGNITTEIGLRLASMKSAWASMRCFWTSAVAPQLKRQLFLSLVVGAAVSGLVAFVLNPKHVRPLDKQVSKYLRVMLRGRATWHDQSKGHLMSLTPAQLRLYWRLSSSVLVDIQVARCRWVRQLVLHPKKNLQVWCALTGSIPGDTAKVLNPDGSRGPAATSFLAQVEADLLRVFSTEGGRTVQSHVLVAGRVSFTKLLADPEVREFFEAFDPGELRAVDLSREQPPVGWQEPAGLNSDSESTSSSGSNQPPQNCPVCGEECLTVRGLVAHLRTKHKFRRLIALCTPGNWCSWCSSTFRSKQIARQHAEQAFATGVCRVDEARWPWVPNELENFDCRVCGQTSPDEIAFRLHLRTHLPAPAPDLEVKIPRITVAGTAAHVSERAVDGAGTRSGRQEGEARPFQGQARQEPRARRRREHGAAAGSESLRSGPIIDHKIQSGPQGVVEGPAGHRQGDPFVLAVQPRVGVDHDRRRYLAGGVTSCGQDEALHEAVVGEGEGGGARTWTRASAPLSLGGDARKPWRGRHRPGQQDRGAGDSRGVQISYPAADQPHNPHVQGQADVRQNKSEVDDGGAGPAREQKAQLVGGLEAVEWGDQERAGPADGAREELAGDAGEVGNLERQALEAEAAAAAHNEEMLLDFFGEQAFSLD